MAVIVKVTYNKAEAGGWRAYVDVVKNGKIRILKTKFFTSETAAKRQATAWKRMYAT
jgi:hypothetical protein